MFEIFWYFWKMKIVMNFKSIILIVLLIVSYYSANAQFFLSGQDPASVKWKQINTQDFKIIFPQGYEKTAMQYANLLELSKNAVNGDYNSKVRKFKIVLHNQTTNSNAMVSPTPFHADFFEMPDQATYAQPWNRQLSLHEYRHAVQMQKMKQGFTLGLYYLIGDQATAIMMGAFLPFWFIEGDAVYSETINSKSGRGRSPDFIMDLKAQILDKKIYSYDKALFGSFKNYTPDHYTLGYQIVLNGVQKYGTHIWDNAMDRTAKYPFMLVPFSSAIKESHGKGKVGLYKTTLEELKTKWQYADSAINKSSNFIKQPSPKDFTNYRFPIKIPNGNFVALKTGIDDISRIVSISPDGIEKRIFTPGYSFENSLSANDSLVCWNERTFDKRWSLQNYSIIKVYNFKTNKLVSVSHKSRFFSPQLSRDGNLISAVEVDAEGNSSIVIIERISKKVINKYMPENGLFLINPQWTNNNSIILIGLNGKGKAIFEYSLYNDEFRQLTDYTFDDIRYATKFGNKLIYTAPFGETNNIYLQNLDSEKIFKLSNTRFNITDLRFSMDGKEIYFSEYTANGYRISTINTDNKLSEPLKASEMKTHFAIDKIKRKNNFILDEAIIPDSNYKIETYSKAANLFNLHSWGPTIIDADNYSFSPGVNLLSQNLLSTSVAILGYYYDLNEQTGKLKFSYDYYGLYPVIKTSVEFAGRRQYYFNDSTNQNDEIRFTETNITLGFSLPLNFTHSKWIWGMQPYIGASQQFLKMNKDSKYKFSTDNFTSLSYQLFIYNQLKRSKRDIFPQWGQNLNLVFRHTPFDGNLNTQLAASSNLYFPGIIRHHGLRLYGSYQKTSVSTYTYSNIISIARGYSLLNFDEFFSLKSDYALPLIYPDLSIPSFIYLKRIYTHLFYDFMYETKPKNNFYSSTGIELYSDWHFLGTAAIFTLGGRYSYRIEGGGYEMEFLLGIGY
jgi:hypothetical protein